MYDDHQQYQTAPFDIQGHFINASFLVHISLHTANM